MIFPDISLMPISFKPVSSRLAYSSQPSSWPSRHRPEDCTTQSALPPADRAALADAARAIATAVQANDAPTLRASSTPDIQRDFGAPQYMVAARRASPKLAGATPNVEQLYVLDATAIKPNPDGSNPEAQFYCSLNRTTMEADFAFPALPPGRYAFVMVSIAAKPIRAACYPCS